MNHNNQRHFRALPGKVKVEFLINPFCLSDRDFSRLDGLCKKYSIALNAYNMWDIEDCDLDGLPAHVSALVRELRSGKRAGSVYSSVFINGERFPINAWHESFRLIERKIIELLGIRRE